MSQDEILTGEAVALEVGAASFFLRAGAWLIDMVITLVMAFTLVWLAARSLANTSSAVVGSVVALVLVFVFVIMPTMVETLSRGRTVGKLAVGIRVVRDDGGPIVMRQALIRALVGFVEIWAAVGSIALITMLLNNKGKRIGDLLAGTYVMRTRGVRFQLLPLVMPPELMGWIAVADVGRLPDDLALRTRLFLQRAAAFSPAVRQRIGLQLAARMEQYVAPAPPLGTHPERYLAAVLCQRRERERALLAARAAASTQLITSVRRLGHGLPDPEN